MLFLTRIPQLEIATCPSPPLVSRRMGSFPHLRCSLRSSPGAVLRTERGNTTASRRFGSIGSTQSPFCFLSLLASPASHSPRPWELAWEKPASRMSIISTEKETAAQTGEIRAWTLRHVTVCCLCLQWWRGLCPALGWGTTQKGSSSQWGQRAHTFPRSGLRETTHSSFSLLLPIWEHALCVFDQCLVITQLPVVRFTSVVSGWID